MTLRLHIGRVVVDRALIGSVDPRDLQGELEAELRRRLADGAGGAPALAASPREHRPEPLALGSRGSLAERLAGTLCDGLAPLGGRAPKGDAR